MFIKLKTGKSKDKLTRSLLILQLELQGLRQKGLLQLITPRKTLIRNHHHNFLNVAIHSNKKAKGMIEDPSLRQNKPGHSVLPIMKRKHHHLNPLDLAHTFTSKFYHIWSKRNACISTVFSIGSTSSNIDHKHHRSSHPNLKTPTTPK